MLIQFSVENYRCFRDRATLSMVPAGADKSQWSEAIVEAAQGSKLNLLKVAAVFGPNASGKSTLIHAIRFMQNFVATSSRDRLKDQPTGVVPFRLDADHASRPSRFEATFLHGGVRWVYGFAIDSHRVVEEWLSNYPVRGERVLFRYAVSDTGKPVEYFGPFWEGPAKALIEVRRDNALLLSVGAQMKSPIAEQVYAWFTTVLREVSWFPEEGSERMFTSLNANKDEARRAQFAHFLRAADLGIRDFSVTAVPLAESPAWLAIPESLRREMLKNVPPEAREFEVRTVHSTAGPGGDPRSTEFRLEDESDGTRKLYALAGPLLFVLEHGYTVVIDELDARLHPRLTEWIVQLFQSAESNPKGAQLIFTTHDESLLEGKLLRRDQLWLTEKDEYGAARLFSLWDFERPPRREENLRRGYRAGRYGAVPIPGPFVSPRGE